MARGQGVTVDYGSRGYTAYPVSANLLGLNGAFNWQDQESSAVSYLSTAGFVNARSGVYMPDIFPDPCTVNESPCPGFNHAPLDTMMANYKSTGLTPLINIAYTPGWLFTTSYCSSTTDQHHNPPDNPAYDDYNTYGWLAAQIVNYIDTNYPGQVTQYEIWNEPDSASYLCAPNNGTRLQEYLNIFGAASQAMYKQWSQDNKNNPNLPPIKIGGPVLANIYQDENVQNLDWIMPFLGNNTIYALYDNENPGHPVVDNINFFDFHEYITGALMANNEDWNNESGCGNTCWHLLQMTQGTQQINPPNPGPSYAPDPAATYELISQDMQTAVKDGYLPASVPVYLTEYNTSSGGSSTGLLDFGQTGPYAYLWNGLLTADLLNSVYNGASAPPAGLYYFSGRWVGPNGSDQYCLLDTDPSGNGYGCYFDDTSVSPYPQYYFYDLLGSPNYLGLSSGGAYMAQSISVNSSLSNNNVVVTGFYTPTADDVLIINNGTTNYTTGNSGQIQVLFQNAGFNSPTATRYVVASSSVSTNSLKINQVSGGYQVSINVPAESVVAVSVQ